MHMCISSDKVIAYTHIHMRMHMHISTSSSPTYAGDRALSRPQLPPPVPPTPSRHHTYPAQP
ncbi:hypothetical protein EON63_07830 [archaeon]|nr:MAG: hypothetical protein EON63_07830 [archaeon]